jgi:GNAT superfamily N-acetyltransferase
MEQTQVAVRRSRTADLEGFDAFVAGLSVETSTRRFFTPTPRLGRRQARLLLANDRTRGAFLAEEGPRVVGHGCWVAVGPTTAELAMVVADGAQRHGLGRRLMRAVARDLSEAGHDMLEMVVQPDNRAIITLINRAWPTARPRTEDGLLTFVAPVAETTSAAA